MIRINLAFNLFFLAHAAIYPQKQYNIDSLMKIDGIYKLTGDNMVLGRNFILTNEFLLKIIKMGT